MSVAKNLRLLRRIRGYTLEDLSEKVGISVSYLSRIESGNRRVTEPILMRLTELLECDPSEIFDENLAERQASSLGFKTLPASRASKESAEKVSELIKVLEGVASKFQNNYHAEPRKIPVFASHYFKNMPEETTATEDALLSSPSDWVVCPQELLDVKDAFAFYVVNDEMKPKYSPGDMLYIHPNKPLTQGCFALILLKNNTTLVRQFIRSDENALVFHQYGNKDNDQTLEQEEIKAVYRIIGSREVA